MEAPLALTGLRTGRTGQMNGSIGAAFDRSKSGPLYSSSDPRNDL